ncbi:MAG: Ribose-5-phosphate isomerase B [Holosporales bacterium]
MGKDEKMKIGIFCDHGGYSLKEELKANFLFKDAILLDFGTYSTDSVDYPDFANKAASALEDQQIDRAILICGTGIGICIAANRHLFVRAFVAHQDFEARLAREHNNANTICFSGRYQDLKTVLHLLDIFLKTPFEGGRHELRIRKISER